MTWQICHWKWEQCYLTINIPVVKVEKTPQTCGENGIMHGGQCYCRQGYTGTQCETGKFDEIIVSSC